MTHIEVRQRSEKFWVDDTSLSRDLRVVQPSSHHHLPQHDSVSANS